MILVPLRAGGYLSAKFSLRVDLFSDEVCCSGIWMSKGRFRGLILRTGLNTGDFGSGAKRRRAAGFQLLGGLLLNQLPTDCRPSRRNSEVERFHSRRKHSKDRDVSKRSPRSCAIRDFNDVIDTVQQPLLKGMRFVRVRGKDVT